MQHLGDFRIDDYVTFGVQLHRFSSGAVYAPTGNVTYTFYENNSTSGAPTGGNLAQLNSKTGLYSARVQLTTAAGFEAGKDYFVHVEATVDSVAAAELFMFRVVGVPTVDVVQIGGDAQSATDLKDFADSGYDPSTNKVQGVVLVDTCTTNSDMRGTDSAATASALSTVEGKVDTIDGIVDAILADTAELQTDWVNGGRLDLLIDAILADTNELQTDWVNGGRLDLLIDAIKVVTDAQGAAGAGLTAVPWNAAWDAEVESEVQDAIEANHLDHLLAADYDPAAKPGVATALLNELIENDGGVSRFTANALEQAPSGGAAPTAAEVADAVWDEALAGHATEGTAGYALDNVSAGASPAAIADAVWDENMAAHIASGSYGYGFDILMNRVLTTQTTEAPLPVGGGMLVDVALERATFIIMATFFDDRGDGIAPDMATWTLTDGLGNVINSRLDVVIANPEAEERIVLSGADLQKTTAKPFELRVLTLEWTYDNGKMGKEEARFYVKELVGV